VFALAGADPGLLATLEKYGTLTDFDNTHICPACKLQSPLSRASLPTST
jgi:hypothetical protein